MKTKGSLGFCVFLCSNICMKFILFILILNFQLAFGATKLHVKDYFYLLYPKGSNKPVSGMELVENHLSNEFFKVNGEMEGHYSYSLFKGDGRDYLVEEITECGPACEQHFKMHIFKDGKLEASKNFNEFYNVKKVEEHIAKMKKILPVGHTKEELIPWLQLPKKNKEIEILILEQNPGTTIGEVGIYRIGKLTFNKNKFLFSSIKSMKVSELHIKEID